MWKNDGEWISQAEACRRLGVHVNSFTRVVKANQIRQRKVEGAVPRYSAADVARAVEGSITIGSREPEEAITR